MTEDTQEQTRLEFEFDQIDALYEEFKAEHTKSVGGNKAAGQRARKAIGEIKKLITDYRKVSVGTSK